MDLKPRPIKNDIPVVNNRPENEKPSRWTFTKVLREYSSLKEYYPEINAYAEAYKFRDNTYCIFIPSACPGLGDMWNYLIIGPEKALLIDTGLGIGDLRGLCEKLAPGKEIICANTHSHMDHIGGNCQFDKVYINKYDAESLEDQNNEGAMRKALLDENGNPKEGIEFDPAAIVEYHHYEVVPVDDGYVFDLGEGYGVELLHLSGHTAGQSAFFDRQTGCMFIGDTTSA
ncbi:MAG: MBL fold metallo-hydrolase, partial [Erysipelotrichaceae bacterium]|nr:MBL fold metallo-hydrolase [Erysipelotrichaceae bacterium]